MTSKSRTALLVFFLLVTTLILLVVSQVASAGPSPEPPPPETLTGLDGGPQRAVGVALGPEGVPQTYIADEIVVRTRDPLEPDAYLVEYDGVILDLQ